MSLSRLIDYLEHIDAALTDARHHVSDMSKDAFLADRRTQQAVTMNLVIIGEGANKIAAIDAAFIKAHDDFPWNSMRGMRNRMVHGYFDINLDVVWDTVQQQFPMLQEQIKSILREQQEASDGTLVDKI